jgi:putative transposase
MFHIELLQARESYRHFVMAGIGVCADQQLIHGRSDEPRILGDDRFLAGIQMHWRVRGHHCVDSLIESLCRKYKVHQADLMRRGRQRRFAELRGLIVHHALEQRIATLSELARRFGRSASTLSESLEHYRRTKPALFLEPLDLE